jgi:dimethylhistidine N-methyltransferase
METLTIQRNEIARDVLKGLTATPKYLLAKYFYDHLGSRIFQDIMNMPEYYLTRCEQEIFTSHKEAITEEFLKGNSENFDLLELGSGDGKKTKVLLKHMLNRDIPFTYIPIDISESANESLVRSFRREMTSLAIEAQTGDYFNVMNKLNGYSGKQRIVLFLGSNIGNFSTEELDYFMGQLSAFLKKGDKVLMGFDLKKSPQIILKAYSDPHGHTRRFNINLLDRLNRELEADFDTDYFEHHANYNPITGTTESYLVSTISQSVHFNKLELTFHFKQWEPIFMEVSRKFDLPAINNLAQKYGFEVTHNFFDKQKYFSDSLWVKK